MTFLDPQEQALVRTCCTDSLHDVESSMQMLQLSEREGQHVLMLRGLLAYDLLLHCLQKRYNVEFGLTGRYVPPLS